MTRPNERDEFERMRLVAQIERARGLVAQSSSGRTRPGRPVMRRVNVDTWPMSSA
jgi:hypothetical protein